MSTVLTVLAAVAAVGFIRLVWQHGYWSGQRDEARAQVNDLRRKLPL